MGTQWNLWTFREEMPYSKRLQLILTEIVCIQGARSTQRRPICTGSAALDFAVQEGQVPLADKTPTSQLLWHCFAMTLSSYEYVYVLYVRICMCIYLIIYSDREHAVGILLYSQSCINRQGETQRKTKGCKGKFWGVDLLQPTRLGDLSLLVDKRRSATQTGKNCIRVWNIKLTFADLKCVQSRLILDRKSNFPSYSPCRRSTTISIVSIGAVIQNGWLVT